MISKNLQAVQIVKDKKVAIGFLEYFDNVEDFNEGLPEEYQLTEEEFKIVKEVYCNDF